MQPEARDNAYIWDMLDSAKAINSFISGIKFEEYLSDRKVQMAVERALEIIGEAARKTSDSFKAEYPEIPWRSIIGLRNVLAHEYGDILQERIWAVASIKIPELIAQLQEILPDSEIS